MKTTPRELIVGTEEQCAGRRSAGRGGASGVVAVAMGGLWLVAGGAYPATGGAVPLADTPAGVYEHADPLRVPGILPTQSAPPDVIDAVRALAEQDAVGARPGGAAAPTESQLSNRPGAASPASGRENGQGLQAPAAMDSGDPDPDRLHAPSIVMSLGHPSEVGQ